MDFHGLDLNLLVALDALLNEGSVTRAGKRLNLTQSSTSSALARLREFFHDQLLVPVGRTLVPTPLAQSLRKPVRDILMQVQGTIAAKAEFDPARSRRTFTLAVSDYVAIGLMVEALKRAKRSAPGVTFDLQLMSESAFGKLEHGSIDMLIIPESVAAATQPKEVLFEESYVCIAWSGNRHIRQSISLEQYLALGHVVARIGGNRETLDEIHLSRAGHARRVEVFAPSFDVVPHLVAGTDRIATVHKRLAAIYARVLSLKILPLPVEMPYLTEVAQWHRLRDLDPAYVWLRGVLKDTATAVGLRI
jgi:DNA-binding transcriptional LysR family regulator